MLPRTTLSCTLRAVRFEKRRLDVVGDERLPAGPFEPPSKSSGSREEVDEDAGFSELAGNLVREQRRNCVPDLVVDAAMCSGESEVVSKALKPGRFSL